MHQETFELNCSRTSLAMDGTLVVVVEMSLSTWLVCAEVGLTMQPKFSSWGKTELCKVVDVEAIVMFGKFNNG